MTDPRENLYVDFCPISVRNHFQVFAEMKAHPDSLRLAQLFATAPDLIVVLKALYDEIQEYDIAYEGSELLEIMSDAKRAIAKAEGKPL